METNPENEIVIYLLVRKDLKMGKGKIGAQCGHAVQELIMRCPKDLLSLYRKTHVYPKICLALKDEDHLDEVMELCRKKNVLYHRVVDAGRTQVEPNTPTVLGIGPITKKTAQDIVGDLKLL